MIAYKLFRKLKNGDIAPLFINKKLRLTCDTWYAAECHPTKGFAVRPGFHVTEQPIAPHLSLRGRQWMLVEIEDYAEVFRPISQGGKWYIANRMKVIGEVSNGIP